MFQPPSWKVMERCPRFYEDFDQKAYVRVKCQRKVQQDGHGTIIGLFMFRLKPESLEMTALVPKNKNSVLSALSVRKCYAYQVLNHECRL